MLRSFLLLCLALSLAACSGGGGGGSSSTSSSSPGSTPTPTLTNFAAISVDQGPTALTTGPNGYAAYNTAYVSITLCAPGTSTCQTIDHIQLDTGSEGLRVLSSALNSAMLSALPLQTQTSGNPVGECYSYVDGYVFGSVRSADFTLGGKTVAGMPFHLIADSGQFANPPASCASGGGNNLTTVQDFGANGILGIGTQTTDCGQNCTVSNGYGAASYYDCPTAGCGAIIARAASTSAPFQQLPNPIAAFSSDNNGTIISLPAVAAGGASSVIGSVYFGIGTQTNNGLGSATILTTTNSSSSLGPGLLIAGYRGRNLDQSFLDTGSNSYFFVDSTIPNCTAAQEASYYCPNPSLSISVTLSGTNGASKSGNFTLYNADSLLNSVNSALPGIGDNPKIASNLIPYINSFDFGLPFFYGRNVYTALEGRTASGTVGPYVAF